MLSEILKNTDVEADSDTEALDEADSEAKYKIEPTNSFGKR